jgi:GNAT superfamily N-acetyltransferase
MVRAVGPGVTVVVRRASAEQTRPLRHAVLRPGLSPTSSVYEQDLAAVHIGAWDGDDIVGCAAVFADPWPGPPPVPDAWRLRGMAVDPTRQGQGIGGLVLAAAIEAARDAGAPLLWANGRSRALPFYLRHGWGVVGEEFVTPDTGLPHYRIVLDLASVPNS